LASFIRTTARPRTERFKASENEKPSLGSRRDVRFLLAHIWHSNAGKGRASVVPRVTTAGGFGPFAER
jgi:hypothetical protein